MQSEKEQVTKTHKRHRICSKISQSKNMMANEWRFERWFHGAHRLRFHMHLSYHPRKKGSDFVGI